MGTTLANIHVYKQDADTIKNLLPDEYVVKEISKDWVTILNRGLMEKDPFSVASELSRHTTSPIITFYYFDDDVMALVLSKQGKDIANCGNDYEGEIHLENCEAFMDELGFHPESIARFTQILQCTDLGKKVDMLEEFLGVALYIDVDFLDNGVEKFICHRGDSIYKDYEQNQS